MSGLSVAGIASGIDSDSIISQMVALETRSLAKLQQRIAFEEAERLTFEDVSSRLQSLRSASSAFAADTLFSSLSATTSDQSILTVSATDAAPRGIHKVKVLQTALAHRIGGSGVEDPIGTKLAAGFTKTDFRTGAGLDQGTLLSGVAAGSKLIESVASSTFDYDANVTLEGQYNGDENISISVELLTDVPGADGVVDLRISSDGVSFKTFNNVPVNGGVISLDSNTYFGNNGVSMTIDSAADTMKDGDTVMFRVRGKSSIEYTVGDGSRKEIIIESDDTLSEVARSINDNSDLGIRADILNDGSATDPYRLILTSLTEGTSGKVDILSNTSIVDLDGVFAEAPVSDSLTYTGVTSVDGTLSSGAGNNTILVEMIEGGAIGAAKFRISADGGLTFHDNDGVGFSLTDDGGGVFSFDLDNATKNAGAGDVFASTLNIDLKFNDDGSNFSVGDRITVDLFDSEIQSAQDALINVNGINLVKSSNVIDDVFSGLTFNLNEADADKTVSINISEKAGDITAAMTGFVDAYNSAMSLIHAQSKFNPEEDDDAPLLMGDATVRQIQSSLQRYVTGRISILNGDTLSSLSDIGITTDSKTGQLVFDSSKLSSALTDDSNAVRRLLSRFGDVVDGSNVSFVGSTSATKAGTYSVNVTQARRRAEVIGGNAQTITVGERLSVSINTDTQGDGSIRSLVVDFPVGMTPAQQVQAIQNEITSRDMDTSVTLEDGKIVIRHNQYGDDFDIKITSDLAAGESGFTNVPVSNTGADLKGTINNVDADVEGDVLVGKDGFGFEDLRVKVSNDFLGTAGSIRLNDGLGSSFTGLIDSFVGFGGVLGTKIQSFDSTISRIQQQMTRVTDRASLLETRLRKQFVNLEVTLGRLNATGEFLNAQLKTLPGVQINKK